MKQSEKVKISEVKVKTYDDQEVVLTLKKHLNQNEYAKVGKYWVRNFSAPSIKPWDINNFYYDVNLKEIIDNEMKNSRTNSSILENQVFSKYRNFLIVSDGYGFDNHKNFSNLPPSVCLIVVNQAARLWECSRLPDFFLINNPSKLCMTSYPTRIFPQLIANKRTNNEFIKRYPNIVYFYDSVPDSYYQSVVNGDSADHIDDYRNPICAAIGIINRFAKGNIFLAFCSSAYSNKRDGMIEVSPEIYQYEPQRTADQLIDANLFFYKFGRPNSNIFYTGYKNNFKFAKYVDLPELIGYLK
jgi:hypothetical protein